MPFCEAVGKDDAGDYYCVKEGVSYYVAPPSYLSTTGNLAIGIPTIRDGDNVVDMIIWRNVDGTFDVGISLDSYKVESNGTITCDSVKIELDEDMNLLEENEILQELLTENRDIIENYYKLAYDMWGILGVP